jgi:hypothetical protein
LPPRYRFAAVANRRQPEGEGHSHLGLSWRQGCVVPCTIHGR